MMCEIKLNVVNIYASEIAEYLSKFMRMLDNTTDSWLMKVYDVNSETNKLEFWREENVMKKLSQIVWKTELSVRGKKKEITAKHVIKQYLHKLTKDGVKFYSNADGVISLFQGYKYNVLDSIDYEIINPFLDLGKEVICNDDELYNNVNGWIAKIIQNPGKKNDTALKGLQGIGKGTFTDILCELLAGYSGENIIDMNEFTGQLNSVVEGRMLLVLNECKNSGENRLANFDALQSFIIDKSQYVLTRKTNREEMQKMSQTLYSFQIMYIQ